MNLTYEFRKLDHKRENETTSNLSASGFIACVDKCLESSLQKPQWKFSKLKFCLQLSGSCLRAMRISRQRLFGTLLIFCLKIPFGELFSKLIILRSSAFLFLKKNRKSHYLNSFGRWVWYRSYWESCICDFSIDFPGNCMLEGLSSNSAKR